MHGVVHFLGSGNAEDAESAYGDALLRGSRLAAVTARFWMVSPYMYARGGALFDSKCPEYVV